MKFSTVNEETSEVSSLIKCLAPGRPRQYRFNGQTGRFNIDGTRDMGTSLTFQPVAWRIFEENLFNRGRNETWAELFFVDSSSALSTIMFNNSSVNELFSLIEPLFYDDLTLAHVVLTVTSEKKKNEKVQPAGTWFLAKFSYVPADAADVQELREYALKNPVYRADTLTATAVYSVVSDTFAAGHTLPAPVAPAELPAPLKSDFPIGSDAARIGAINPTTWKDCMHTKKARFSFGTSRLRKPGKRPLQRTRFN